MQLFMASHKNTKASIKILKTRVGQLAKQLVDTQQTHLVIPHKQIQKSIVFWLMVIKKIVVEAMEDEVEKGPDEEESQQENCEIIQQALPQRKRTLEQPY